MTNAEKIMENYRKVAEIHATCFPQMRMGQMFSNWLGWLVNVKKVDMFFPNDERMIEYLKEYAENPPQLNYGYGLLKEKEDED